MRSRRSRERPADELQPTLRAALRVGADEFLFVQGVPPHAAVNETVELCKRVAGVHTAGLANAVLRKIAGAGEHRGLAFPLPCGTRTRTGSSTEWEEMLGEADAEAVMVAQNEPPELAVRLNGLRAAAVDLGVPVHGDPNLPEAIVIDGPFDVSASAELAAGLIWPQSRAAMLPARLLAPEPGMRCSTCAPRPGGRPASWRPSWATRESSCALSAMPAAPGPCMRPSTGSARRAPESSSPMRSGSPKAPSIAS